MGPPKFFCGYNHSLIAGTVLPGMLKNWGLITLMGQKGDSCGEIAQKGMRIQPKFQYCPSMSHVYPFLYTTKEITH